MANTRRRYTADQRERSTTAVIERLPEYDSTYKACTALAPEFGVGKESLRRWVLDRLEGNGVATNGHQRRPQPQSRPQPRTVPDEQHVVDLELQVQKLREANDALKTLYAQEVLRV